MCTGAFRAALRDSKANGDAAPIGRWLFDHTTGCFDDARPEELNTFPEDILRLLCEALRDPDYLQVRSADLILDVVTWEWGRISMSQRKALLEALEFAYPRFHDWMGRFRITELCGKYFGDESALQMLVRLKNLDDDLQRSLLPHGLEHLIAWSESPEVASKAAEQLDELGRDPSPVVRHEVECSRARLSARRR